jgi:hypothetical protein
MILKASMNRALPNTTILSLLVLAGTLFLNASIAFADVNQGNSTMTNGVFSGVGNGINGSANGSVINSSNTTVQTGANTNTNSSAINNSNANTVVTPTQSVSSGGSSALVLPRNPLALPNAALGRSNFGLQFGVNNNPGFSQLFGKGAGDALGWFMQGGVTIPFGKIPDILTNPRNAQLDDSRQQKMGAERQVFGTFQNPAAASQQPQTNVQGRVVSLNAYNYATAPSPKVTGLQDALKEVEAQSKLMTPKVLALADALVYSKPLGKGDKVGSIMTGDEYKYIAHTSSGWVKIVLPNGREGWVKGQFEYLKNDYTEVDTITLNNMGVDNPKEAATPVHKGKISFSNLRK